MNLPSTRRTDLCIEPSWIHRAPHLVQKARLVGPMTMTTRTDWQTGHLDMGPRLL